MRIMISSTGTSNVYDERAFHDLDAIHPMACVAWDRDGISEVLEKIEPNGNYLCDCPYPRLWKENFYLNGGVVLLSLYYGRYSFPLAQFITAPEPHWQLSKEDIENAIHGRTR